MEKNIWYMNQKFQNQPPQQFQNQLLQQFQNQLLQQFQNQLLQQFQNQLPQQQLLIIPIMIHLLISNININKIDNK